MKHCASCGEKRRLRWPADDPVCCSMRCAAEQFYHYRGAALWEGATCGDCGRPDPSCSCDDEE